MNSTCAARAARSIASRLPMSRIVASMQCPALAPAIAMLAPRPPELPVTTMTLRMGLASASNARRRGWHGQGRPLHSVGRVQSLTIAPMLQQRTLKSLTRAVGVGVHSGQKVELTLKPAPPDSGIVFRRTDLPQPVSIAVNPQAVSDTRMASTISAGGDPGAPRCDCQALAIGDVLVTHRRTLLALGRASGLTWRRSSLQRLVYQTHRGS